VGLLLAAPSALARPTLYWGSPTPVSTGAGEFLIALSCPSASLCVTFDNLGAVYTSYPVAGATAAWSRHQSVDHDAVQALACPTTRLCVAVDAVGHVLTSTNPSAGATASWKETYVGRPEQLMDISCPSASLCVAVDQAGYVLTSTDPAAASAAAWRRERVAALNTNYSGAAVDCPTRKLCVALGNTVVSSADPADGASAKWAPTKARYRGAPITGDDISCPSSTLCVIVGYPDPGRAVAYHTVTSTNPGAGAVATWSVGAGFQPVPLAHPVISCPSRSLCVAVGNVTGEITPETFTTTDAGAGARASWTASTRAFGVVVSCPTRGLCVTAGGPPGGGGVQVGTASPSWSHAIADGPAPPLSDQLMETIRSIGTLALSAVSVGTLTS